MYEELIENLHFNAKQVQKYGLFAWKIGMEVLLLEAADAIEVMCNMVATAHNELANVIQSYEESKPRWIPVTEQLPEEREGLEWHEDMRVRFMSVWCCSVETGSIGVRNRFQEKMTGNEHFDQYVQDTDWHWSKAWWEPTHWMPIVPLPEPPKEET